MLYKGNFEKVSYALFAGGQKNFQIINRIQSFIKANCQLFSFKAKKERAGGKNITLIHQVIRKESIALFLLHSHLKNLLQGGLESKRSSLKVLPQTNLMFLIQNQKFFFGFKAVISTLGKAHILSENTSNRYLLCQKNSRDNVSNFHYVTSTIFVINIFIECVQSFNCAFSEIKLIHNTN